MRFGPITRLAFLGPFPFHSKIEGFPRRILCAADSAALDSLLHECLLFGREIDVHAPKPEDSPALCQRPPFGQLKPGNPEACSFWRVHLRAVNAVRLDYAAALIFSGGF